MNNDYNASMIQSYLNGTLSPSDRHQIEKEALADPFLQDAIDGFDGRGDIGYRQLSLLQQRLEARIAGQQQARNVFHFNMQRLAIASTAGVLLIVFSVLFWMRTQPTARTTPATKEVAVELSHTVTATRISGNASPEMGWARYNEYLATHRKTDETGRVNLSFDVKAGKAYRIQVVSSTDDTLAKEAVRLIQEGPVWTGDSTVIAVDF